MKKAKNKKVCCIFLTAAVLSGISVYSVSAEETKTEIHIVHTNDIHGYYKSTSNGQIGFDSLKTIVSKENADLLLDAGDTFHGQSFATVENGKSIAELMDDLGYDAMTPGNHDWSYGADRVKELDGNSTFKVLAANVVDDNGDSFFDNTYFVKTVTADDGTELKVGVFGVTDESFYTSTASKNVENVRFTEDTDKANEVAQKLRNDENCDIVLAITHNNNLDDFVANTSGIDAVIAGHQHILIDKDYTNKDGKSVRVVEAGYYFYDVGVLTLTYDKELGVTQASEKVYTSAETQDMSDADIAEKISAIEKREESVLNEVIGESKNDYPYSWEEIRTSEQKIGRIVTAAYLDYTGADVAMENAGGIRSGIRKGNITYSDLISISPYGNVLIEKELTGSQIMDILNFTVDLMKENSAVYDLQKEAIKKGEDPYQYSWPNNSGSVMQFSGLSAEYNFAKPQGNRVSNVLIGGKPIDLNKTYKVVSNNYAFSSSDYGTASTQPIAKEYTTCEQALRDYISKGNFEQAAEKENLLAKADVTEPTTVQPTTVQPATSVTSPAYTEPSTAAATTSMATADSAAKGNSQDNNTVKTSGYIPTLVALLALVSGGTFAVLVGKKCNKD